MRLVAVALAGAVAFAGAAFAAALADAALVAVALAGAALGAVAAVAFVAARLGRRGRLLAGAALVARRLLRLGLGLGAGRESIEQDGHARQLATLEEFERGTAAGRDVGHLVGQALTRDRGHRIAAADDDRGAVLGALSEHPGHGVRAVGERRDLEHAQGAVPEDGPHVGERLDHEVLALLPEIDDVPRRRDLLGEERLVLGAAGDLLGHDDVDRQDDPDALRLGGRQDPPRIVDPIGLGEALADRLALRQQERVGHPATEDQHVDLGQQVVDDPDLVGHLGAAEDGRERVLGVLDQLRQRGELALHEQARVRRQQLGDPDGRGVGAVRRPERVVDVDVGVGRELRGELRVVGLFLGVEPEVLEQQQLPRSQALEGILGAEPERVPRHRDVATQQFGEALADGPQAQAVGHLAVRPAEVARQDHPGTLLDEQQDGRDRGPDPRVIGDLAVGQRDVEVDADEDAFAGDVGVADGELVHGVPAAVRRPRRAGAPRRGR